MKPLKYLVIILITLSGYVGVSQINYAHFFLIKPDKNNDLKRNHLKGKVKSIEIKTYLTKQNFGNFIKDKMTTDETTNFDIKGNAVEIYKTFKTTRNKKGTYHSEEYMEKSLINKYTYIYNGNSIIELKEYDGKGNLTFTGNYQYNKHNDIIIGTNKFPNAIERIDTIHYLYDSIGNMKESIDGYSYDYIYHNKYDDKGNIIISYVRGSYDREGNGSGNRTTYEYNNDNNLIKIVSPNDIEEFKYDDNGNIVEDDYDDLKLTKTFKYNNIDKNGNWHIEIEDDSKAITIGNDDKEHILERTIEYYQ